MDNVLKRSLTFNSQDAITIYNALCKSENENKGLIKTFSKLIKDNNWK